MQPSLEELIDAPSGSDEALTRDLGLLLRNLMERSNSSVFAAFDELDLSFTQAKLVMAFGGRGDETLSVNAIADLLGVSLAAASRGIDALLKRGLLTRTEAEHDRRIKQIALTPDGRRITERLVEHRLAGISDFVATLPPDHRRRLAAALEPIVDA